MAKIPPENACTSHAGFASVVHILLISLPTGEALRDIRLHAEQQLAWVLQRMSVSHSHQATLKRSEVAEDGCTV